jgi:hypothetical protein
MLKISYISRMLRQFGASRYQIVHGKQSGWFVRVLFDDDKFVDVKPVKNIRVVLDMRPDAVINLDEKRK